jgi:2-iminobutanoate/2-iminopropanoate deaminase
MSVRVGPYAPAVRAGEWLVVSGQVGVRATPSGPALVDGGFEAEARQALANLEELLSGRGLGWSNVVKATIYLADIADYDAFNAVWSEVLGSHRPARSVVGVAGLPLGARVEVEAWAFAPGQ